MAVSRYFGLPGCGKTTTLAMLAYKARCSCRYKHIYCNVDLALDGVTYVPFDVLGPEAIYRLEVEDFPLTVAIDCNGNTLY